MAFFSGKQAEDTCNIKKSRLINSHLEFLSSCEGSLLAGCVRKFLKVMIEIVKLYFNKSARFGTVLFTGFF